MPNVLINKKCIGENTIKLVNNDMLNDAQAFANDFGRDVHITLQLLSGDVSVYLMTFRYVVKAVNDKYDKEAIHTWVHHNEYLLNSEIKMTTGVIAYIIDNYEEYLAEEHYNEMCNGAPHLILNRFTKRFSGTDLRLLYHYTKYYEYDCINGRSDMACKLHHELIDGNYYRTRTRPFMLIFKTYMVEIGFTLYCIFTLMALTVFCVAGILAKK